MRLSFSRRTELALASLRELAEAPGNRLSRTELAEKVGATPGFIAQVMPFLVAAGWVRSERGPGGGYVLTPEAFGARVIDVYELMEGRAAYGRCVLRDGPCPESSCEVHAVWAEARQVLIDGLQDMRVLQGEMS
ncbi:MAG TPA: Rrf2 family transcriptional regulator [Acidimicrobiia bacterium]|jgi:Rrf2 family protein